MNAKDLCVALDAIHKTLDSYLGDTDPHIDPDMESSEIREQHPIFWCCQLAGMASREWQEEDWTAVIDRMPPEPYEVVLGYNIEKGIRGLVYWIDRSDGVQWSWNGLTGPGTTIPDYWHSLPSRLPDGRVP